MVRRSCIRSRQRVRLIWNFYRPAVDALLARMAEASRTHGGGPAPQILRAMENLKLEALWDEPKTTFKTLSQKFAENARERCRPISCRRKKRAIFRPNSDGSMPPATFPSRTLRAEIVKECCV